MEDFTKQLEECSFFILDMYYRNNKSVLSLLIRLEIFDSADMDSLRKKLDKVAKKYQLELMIRQLPEMTIDSPVHSYFLTLLNQQLRPEFLTKLFRHLQERLLCITAVRLLKEEDLQVLEKNQYRSAHRLPAINAGVAGTEI